MRTLRSLFGPPSRGLVLATLLAAQPAAAAVNSFTLAVPRKPAPQLQIGQIVLTVQADTEAVIGFTVTPPAGAAQGTPNLTPAVAPATSNLFFGADLVQVTPPDTSGLGASDPRRRNYRFVFSLQSDFDANCQTVMAGNETWTIAVTGGASRVTDACAVSFDENVAANECNGALRLVPHSEPFATLTGLSSQGQTCRFGLDAMLVLDRSGSMSSKARPADPAGADNVRIGSLRAAVGTFVSTLDAVRATESTSFGQVPSDNVGVVIFNGDAANLGGLAAGLNPFNPANSTAITTGINGTAPSGSTSIGDGVFSADADLGPAAANRRHVMLLMSDGQQNTDRLLGADVAGHRVFTHPPSTACPPGDPLCVNLAHLGAYQIYTVTVGLGVGPAAEQLNQDVALATGGFYLNSETDAGKLPAFFGGLLQNFLETTTWQTVLSGFDSASPRGPFTAQLPITSTTQAVTFTLTPRVPGRGFCLRVTPPGGTPLDPACGSGTLTLSATPVDVGRDLGGNWQVEVEARVTPQNFHLLVLADDVGVGARVVASSATYLPGDPVRVEAHISQLGEAITGLDPSRLHVTLASPTTTLGELLAASGAGTALPPGDGAIDDANAKLQNAAEADPAAFAKTAGGLELRDDGTGGDRTAGDGIYSAEVTLQEYGNTDLVVTLAGTSSKGGAFLRQKDETIHLKAVPDGSATQVSTQVIPAADGTSVLVIRMVPKTRFGFRVGPGWGNYLWFTTPGRPPIKAHDNLDGSYTASVPFSGATPPSVDVHVFTDSVVISDQVPPDKLPHPLDGSNVLVAGIGATPAAAGAGPWSLSLHAGVSDARGDIGAVCDGDLSLGVDLEYRFNPTWAAELFYGHEKFDCSGETGKVNHLSLNGKAYFLPGPWRPFVGAGVGEYDFSPGPSETGYNLFAGLQANPRPRLGVEATVRYHFVDVSGVSTDFVTYHLGVRFRF
jgi:Outer membrane protein beta-barrel domain/von Willebrand factor type A domain